jgi:hypothetical protein
MLTQSVFTKCRRQLAAHAARGALALGFALALCLPNIASAQTQVACGPEVREEVARTLAAATSESERRALEAELYAKYKFCLQDAKLVTTSSTFYTAARRCGATISQLGSLVYEEMPCCGYDPQRRQFACPVQVKRRDGFGFGPLPGSRLHVLHCVADSAGAYQPVGHDSVHLSNELFGQQPTWQFAVIANAHENLHLVQPMSGETRKARSILAWNATPTGCNYQPTWGNALNYRIRLDQ